MFVCSNCEHTLILKVRIKHRCAQCGHTDPCRRMIKYKWRTRSAGYTRLFPPEEIGRAQASINKARRQGVVFSATHTFAGLRVTVLSIPPNRKKIETILYWLPHTKRPPRHLVNHHHISLRQLTQDFTKKVNFIDFALPSLYIKDRSLVKFLKKFFKKVALETYEDNQNDEMANLYRAAEPEKKDKTFSRRGEKGQHLSWRN